MFTIQDFFSLGMKRALLALLPNYGTQINLGPGYSPITGTIGLELPDWDANVDPIPYVDNSVDVIHAYHFFEHINDPVKVLAECQRVLIPGGHINIVVPHWKCELAYEDVTHIHRFTEGTWGNILNNKGYENNTVNWKLKIHVNFIMGIVERNMAVFTQLVKTV